MKQKRLLSMLVLLAAVVSGAWAQEPATYKITLAEGTEDAENWTVPAEAAAGSPVTATYNGTKKVKSVKAVKKAAAPAPVTVTWNNNDITGSGKSFTKDGVTITAGWRIRHRLVWQHLDRQCLQRIVQRQYYGFWQYRVCVHHCADELRSAHGD